MNCEFKKLYIIYNIKYKILVLLVLKFSLLVFEILIKTSFGTIHSINQCCHYKFLLCRY